MKLPRFTDRGSAATSSSHGPSGIGELRGAPKLVRASAKANDQALARELWAESERLTGVDYGPTLRPV